MKQPSLFHAVLWLWMTGLSATAAETAPAFELAGWPQGNPTIRLEDFAGQILILDFFAYWCAPCQRASKELETGVQQFYAAQKGNPAGIPVRVLSVNIEKDFPLRTAEFVQRTGASFVANDTDGTLLKQFGQAGIPFLVVVDGSKSPPDAPRFDVVYKHAGFEGLGELRKVIDSIGGTGPPSRSIPDALAAPIIHTPEVDTEFAWASDILLTDSRVKYGQQIGATEWDAAFSYATFDMEYRPNLDVDGLGFSERLHEDRFGGQLNLRRRIVAPVTLLASAGLYKGYPDYRRVWIANRYRQKYDHPKFTRIPPYETPDPRGANGSLGARWEYLPTLGFAELRFGYSRDYTAPGYEDSVDAEGDHLLLKGREGLDTRTLTLSSENVLTSRLRVLNELSFTDTTARELRFTYQGSINIAVSERWVVRGYGGLSTEKPQFDAHFFGLTLEYELLPNLSLSLTGRYYRDTGEIENSLLSVTSAAPPLRSWEAGTGLRWVVGRSTFKVYVAPFWTDYRPQAGIGKEFKFLYSDRNWGLAQAAWSMQF